MKQTGDKKNIEYNCCLRLLTTALSPACPTITVVLVCKTSGDAVNIMKSYMNEIIFLFLEYRFCNFSYKNLYVLGQLSHQ